MFASVDSQGQPVRRSLRVAHMTPSKGDAWTGGDGAWSDAESEVTVRPLRLLGQQQQRGRSKSPSRSSRPRSKRNTPSKATNNQMPSDLYPSIPQGRLPLRLDTPQPISPPDPRPGIMDSRVKHARNLDALDHDSLFGDDWPIHSLMTPLQSRPPPVQRAEIEHRAEPAKGDRPSAIFKGGRKNSAATKSISLPKLDNWRQYLSFLILLLSFTATLLYRGEILEWVHEGVEKFRVIRQTVPVHVDDSGDKVVLDAWRLDLERLTADLEQLKFDLAKEKDSPRESKETIVVTETIGSEELARLSFLLDEQSRNIDELRSSLGKRLDDISKNKLAEIQSSLDITAQVVSRHQTQIDQNSKKLETHQKLIESNSRSIDEQQKKFEGVTGQLNSMDSAWIAKELDSLLPERLETPPVDRAAISSVVDEKLRIFEQSIAHQTAPQTTKERPEEPVAELVFTNFATEAAGCRPILALSSPTYNPSASSASSFWPRFLSIGSSTRPHRVAISSDNSFGNCWPLKGNSGHLTLQLAFPIIPTHFSVCHLAKMMAEDRSSAPHFFEVHAIPSISVPDETILLGKYQYDLEGNGCQSFRPHHQLTAPVRHFQLRILSNHGRSEYTCLYQFGIHSDHLM